VKISQFILHTIHILSIISKYSDHSLKEKIFKWPQGAKGVKNEVILGIFYFYSFIFFLFLKGRLCLSKGVPVP